MAFCAGAAKLALVTVGVTIGAIELSSAIDTSRVATLAIISHFGLCVASYQRKSRI